MPDPLTVHQRRVLGVLIEKQKTSKSADAYPMTLNSIVIGCNQKSNREPVLELDEETVEATLLELNARLLAQAVHGGRVERWRHMAYDEWKASKEEMAVLAELLLRGPQTEGELRGRASRMNDIPDLETLRAHLQSLAAKNLVVYQSNRGRGSVISHGFHSPAELEQAKNQPHQSGESPTPTAQKPTLEPTQYERLLAEIAELKQRVTALEAKS